MRERPRASWLSVILAAALLACWGTRPGVGAKAERGYQRAAPVLTALDQFRAVRGSYPDSLSELVPGFLSDSGLAIPERTQERYPFEYHRRDSTFVLSFRYVGPGMNTCSYASIERKWQCSGLL